MENRDLYQNINDAGILAAMRMKDGIEKGMDEALKETEFKFTFESTDSRKVTEYINSVNMMYANVLKRVMQEADLFRYDENERKIFDRDPDCIEFLSFLPCIYPELANMDEDDWLPVTTGDDEHECAKIHFYGQEETNDEGFPSVKLGYKFALKFNDPVKCVEVDINVEPVKEVSTK